MVGEEEELDWMTPYKSFLIWCCHQRKMKSDTKKGRLATVSYFMVNYSKEG